MISDAASSGQKPTEDQDQKYAKALERAKNRKIVDTWFSEAKPSAEANLVALRMIVHVVQGMEKMQFYLGSKIYEQQQQAKASGRASDELTDPLGQFRLYRDFPVLVHARLLQPLLDISLLFIGLPLVVSNKSQNVFLAIGLNLLLVVFYFLAQLLSHTLGTEGFVSPALAAWIPIFIFVPLAYLGLRKLS